MNFLAHEVSAGDRFFSGYFPKIYDGLNGL
jgi:hypothetical protein